MFVEKIVFWCMSSLKQEFLCFKIRKSMIVMHGIVIDEHCMIVNWIIGCGVIKSGILHVLSVNSMLSVLWLFVVLAVTRW